MAGWQELRISEQEIIMLLKIQREANSVDKTLVTKETKTKLSIFSGVLYQIIINISTFEYT